MTLCFYRFIYWRECRSESAIIKTRQKKSENDLAEPYSKDLICFLLQRNLLKTHEITVLSMVIDKMGKNNIPMCLRSPEKLSLAKHLLNVTS